MLWSKQFYHYVVRDWLNGDPGQPAPPERARHGRNWQWPHLYNSDVISMPDKWEYPWYAAWDLAFHCVRACARRLRVRQGPADPAAARVVHASERAVAGVRVGARRRQSARARMGRVACLQDRKASPRHGRSAVPRARLPQAADQLHLVGQPEGRRGHERVPGRLPRTRQHRRVRSQRRPSDRRAPRTIRRHELDGHVHAEHAGHRDGARARRLDLRGRRQQVLGTLPLHRRRDEQPRAGRRFAVGRGGRLLLRRAAPKRTATSSR